MHGLLRLGSQAACSMTWLGLECRHREWFGYVWTRVPDLSAVSWIQAPTPCEANLIQNL